MLVLAVFCLLRTIKTVWKRVANLFRTCALFCYILTTHLGQMSRSDNVATNEPGRCAHVLPMYARSITSKHVPSTIQVRQFRS